MQERITFVLTFNTESTKKINSYTKNCQENLCKVPFGKNVDNRLEADTLPYHVTLSAWNIEDEERVNNALSQIEFPKLKIQINSLGIMNGKENSYVLYFDVEKSEQLKLLQSQIYQVLPSKNYNPENFNFHITIHIDKDYNKILAIKEKILETFKPFTLEVAA